MATRAEKERAKSLQTLHDYKFTFGSEEGKRVLRRLMAETGFFAPIHTTDPNQALVTLARQSVVAQIIQVTKMKPEQLERFYDRYQEEFNAESQ